MKKTELNVSEYQNKYGMLLLGSDGGFSKDDQKKIISRSALPDPSCLEETEFFFEFTVKIHPIGEDCLVYRLKYKSWVVLSRKILFCYIFQPVLKVKEVAFEIFESEESRPLSDQFRKKFKISLTELRKLNPADRLAYENFLSKIDLFKSVDTAFDFCKDDLRIELILRFDKTSIHRFCYSRNNLQIALPLSLYSNKYFTLDKKEGDAYVEFMICHNRMVFTREKREFARFFANKITRK